MTRITSSICILIGILLMMTYAHGADLKFNRKAAKDYAALHCGTSLQTAYNHAEYKCYTGDKPECVNYGSGNHVDCANFASQALIAAGLNFGCVKNSDVIGKDGYTKGEPLVAHLVSALQNSFCFKPVHYLMAQPGDILSYKAYSHVVIYTGDGKYCGHTNDKCGDNINWSEVTVYHFQDDDKCKKCEREWSSFNTCTAKMKDKATACETCNETTGQMTPKCPTYLGGICAPKVTCEIVKDSFWSVELGKEILTDIGICKSTPGGDCPDETFTVGTGATSDGIMPSTNSFSNVAILENGYPYDMSKLLSSFGQDARIIKAAELSPDMDAALLIIPTGGLNGMDNSEFFKLVLEEYVKRGWKILMLSQQYGYEYAVLPGGLAGYGWAEDQSCFSNSTYIDTWHNALSGQTKSTPSLSVDGYFSKFPDNATILLRRTANGQPACLLYPYGNGYVIAGTSYTDWAYSTGQAADDERRLIRDIVTWAKSPATLTEINPGETANVNLTITNHDESETATAAEIELYDPDQKVIKLRAKIPVTLAPGESTQIPLTYATTTADPLGIYNVRYGLLTEGYELLTSEMEPEGVYVWDESLLQPPTEEPSGRFVVSNPPNKPYKSSDLNFAVNSDSEHYLYGSNATFTVTIWNNGNTDRTITASYYAYHLNVSGSPKTVTVPAHSSASFQVIASNITWQGWLVVRFMDESNKQIGEQWKGIWMAPYPLINVAVQSDKSTYSKGEIVALSTSLRNDMSGSYDISEKTIVTDPSGVKIFEDTKPVSITSHGTGNIASNFTLSQAATTGTYTVRTEAWYGSMLASTGLSTFELPKSQISVAPDLSTLGAGLNTIPFTLNNTGKIPVSSGVFDVSLKDPDGVVISTSSQLFSLAVGESKTLNIPVSIPSLKFGNYTLTYSQSDETKTSNPSSIAIRNSSTVNISMDKPSYKIGEPATIAVSVNNTGKFVNEGALTIDMQFLGFTDTKTIKVNPSEVVNIPYGLSLPHTLKSGGDIHATFIDSSGNILTKTMSLIIAALGIDQNIVFDKPSYRIRENLGMKYTVTNNGNFASPMDASFRLSIPDLNYEYNSILTLEPGKQKDIPITLLTPETITSGQHQVLTSITLPSGAIYQGSFAFTIPEANLVIRDPGKYNFTAGEMINLTIDNTGGVDAADATGELTMTDNKGVVIYQGNITGTIRAGEIEALINMQIPLQTANGQGYLYASIKDSKTSKTSYFYKALSITGLTATLQTRTDKETYLKTETINSLSNIINGQFDIGGGSLKLTVIGRKSSDTMEYASWGSNGTGNGQFNLPRGIAVGPDGSVYVADAYNYRIQKFDSNGNFITKWGRYGSGNGYFYVPEDITVASDGSVYVADTFSHRVQKFTSDGTFITKWGSYSSYLDGKFYGPYGIAAGPDSAVYVADSYNHRIQKFDSNGNFITKWGSYGSGNGQFDLPWGIAVGSNGSVYVADTNNNRVQKFTDSGNFITKWGGYGSGDGQFDQPKDISEGSGGSVYVADRSNNRIQKFDSNGNFITKWGSTGSANGQFNNPEGIAAASDGSLYVVDTFNNRIQKMTPLNGDIETLFETTIPITQSANTNQDFTTSIGTLNTTGKLYLQAELKNSIGQTIAISEYPFYIIEGNMLLLFSTDKKVYRPGETVTISGQVQNLASVTASALSLQLSANTQNIYNATFDVPANGVYPFTATSTAGTEGPYALTGKITQNNSTLLELSDNYETAKPKVTATVTTPEVAGDEPFSMNMELKNECKVAASIQIAIISDQGNTIDNQQITIPAGETRTIQYQQQITGDATYTFTFTGDLNQTITKNVIFGLKADIQPDIKQAYKEGSITIPYTLRNTGMIEATYVSSFSLSKDGQEVSTTSSSFTLPPNAGTSDFLTYNLSEGHYVLRYETTGFKSESQFTVIKPGQGAIALSLSEIYPEGAISIPYTITNTGQFDSEFTVDFILGPNVTSKRVFIPTGMSYSDMLQYPLSAGSYTITATITSYPSTPASKSFRVLKENYALIDVAVSSQASGLIPVTVTLTNSGYNSIEGIVQLSIVSSQGATAWNGSQNVSLTTNYQSPNPNPFVFSINPSAITPGDYTLKAELLNNSNQQIVVYNSPFTIHASSFEVTQLPAYQTFNIGQEASFTFKVKNSGNQEGALDFSLKSYDLIDATQREWLKPGEEKTMNFSFLLPEDLETKDYFADYTLTPALSPSGEGVIKGQIKYHLAGINLNVNASLDKQYYTEGDTAHLTIAVSNQQSASQSLFARVNYAGYESQQAFIIGEGQAQPLQFEIPLAQITGEKLFYGIYQESGRSIHLNSLYIYKTGDAITITTDKQVYNPGENVTVGINSQQSAVSGTMTLTAPDYKEMFVYPGAVSKSVKLPSVMTAGTYTISAQLSTSSGETYTANHPFDVSGIQVKVLECKNNKVKYASSDTIKTNFTISSNTTMPATLKAWIVDPEDKYTSAGEKSINLISAENLLLASDFSLLTAVSGIHRLIYGIYAGDMLLVSGSEAFDVGDAVLLGLSTDKPDYPTNTESVSIAASMFGTVGANLELQLDGTTVKAETVSLNGFEAVIHQLSAIKPGTRILKGVLTAGGLQSTKETSFVYGSNLPDLTTAFSSQQPAVSRDNTLNITATVINQGRTEAAATTVALYDGDALIETKQINALNPGESQDVVFIWNVLGKSGEHILKAIIDPDDMVTEFNEGNNSSQFDITIPDLSLITETDKDTYKIRQKVNISASMTNLTSARTYSNITLLTSAIDPEGAEVYTNNAVIEPIEASSSASHVDVWKTIGLVGEGPYTIRQTILYNSQVLAQSSSVVNLRKAPDFTLSVIPDYQKIKQGENALYTVYLGALNGWNSQIALETEGLPAGTSVSFSPGYLVPPGEALTLILTTDASIPGPYNINLSSEGVDEGETVTHTSPIALDISGFGLEMDQSILTIKQLESKTFDIKVDFINGYEGNVALNINGVPHGVRVVPAETSVDSSGNVRLNIQTSKYVRPGIYEFLISGEDGLVKHSLSLVLNIEKNPQLAEGIMTTQGPGPNNNANIRIFNMDLQPVTEFTAFDTQYGAYAATADIDGDGYDEIIVSEGPGPKNTATFRVYSRSGAFMGEYTPFDTKYGLTISSGDIDGDWKDELILGMGPDPKNPAVLKILKYDGNGFTEMMSRTMYSDAKYGINTATGDIDGDGVSEIITAPGPGPDNKALIKIWKLNGQTLMDIGSFTAFDGSYGANISTGDIDGDGNEEIIAGTGPGPKNPAEVKVYKANGVRLLSFMPYDDKHAYGVNVAAADLDGDGIDEIITGLGPGPQDPSWVKVFKADSSEVGSFYSFSSGPNYGVKVFRGRTGNQ